MTHKKIKNISTIVLIFSAVFGSAFFVSKTQAGTSENGIGWLWGGTDYTSVGWISMNNTSGGGVISYGVTIPVADGTVTGYGWSDNIGWISFNAADLVGCPSGTCSTQRVGNNIIGWARVVGIKTEGVNAGGWLGWIKLAGTNYAVSIDPVTNKFSGYAWSDELGWIDFSRASMTMTPPPPPPVCVPTATYTYSCSNGVSCACGPTTVTNTWICMKTDNCGNISADSQFNCTAKGKTCSNTTCPACPVTRDLNWREVSPN